VLQDMQRERKRTPAPLITAQMIFPTFEGAITSRTSLDAPSNVTIWVKILVNLDAKWPTTRSYTQSILINAHLHFCRDATSMAIWFMIGVHLATTCLCKERRERKKGHTNNLLYSSRILYTEEAL